MFSMICDQAIMLARRSRPIFPRIVPASPPPNLRSLVIILLSKKLSPTLTPPDPAASAAGKAKVFTAWLFPDGSGWRLAQGGAPGFFCRSCIYLLKSSRGEGGGVEESPTA